MAENSFNNVINTSIKSINIIVDALKWAYFPFIIFKLPINIGRGKFNSLYKIAVFLYIGTYNLIPE